MQTNIVGTRIRFEGYAPSCPGRRPAVPQSGCGSHSTSTRVRGRYASYLLCNTHTDTQSHINTQRGGSIHACMCVSMSLYCITYPRMCRARPQLKKLRGPPWSPPHPASAVVGTTLRSAGATPTCSRKQPRISTSDKRKNEQGQFLLSRIRSSWPRSGARDR